MHTREREEDDFKGRGEHVWKGKGGKTLGGTKGDEYRETDNHTFPGKYKIGKVW